MFKSWFFFIIISVIRGPETFALWVPHQNKTINSKNHPPSNQKWKKKKGKFQSRRNLEKLVIKPSIFSVLSSMKLKTSNPRNIKKPPKWLQAQVNFQVSFHGNLYKKKRKYSCYLICKLIIKYLRPDIESFVVPRKYAKKCIF